MKVPSILISVVFAGQFAIVLAEFREYGADCSSSSPCRSSDTHDPLICHPAKENSSNGVCGCPWYMFRHIKLKRCVSPEGSPCTHRPNNGSPIDTCTEFAHCRTEKVGEKEFRGICQCDGNSQFDEATGLCRILLNGNGCEGDADCDINASLKCLHGKCVEKSAQNVGKECNNPRKTQSGVIFGFVSFIIYIIVTVAYLGYIAFIGLTILVTFAMLRKWNSKNKLVALLVVAIVAIASVANESLSLAGKDCD